MAEPGARSDASGVHAMIEAERGRRLAGTRVITLALVVLGALGTAATIFRAGFTPPAWNMILSTLVMAGAAWLARVGRAERAVAIAISTMLLQHVVAVATTPAAMNSPTPYFSNLAIFFAVVTLGPRGVVATTAAVGVALLGMLGLRAHELGFSEATVEHAIPLLLWGLMGVIAIVQSANASRSFQSQLAREVESERVRAQAKSNAARFELIAGNTDDLVALLSADLRVLFASPSHERVLGLAPGELEGQRPADFMAEDQRAAYEAAARGALAGTPGRVEVCATREAFGTRWFDIAFRRIVLEDGPYVVSSARDVTERVAIEERLEEAKRLEALGRLSGAVAHDFNNLLLVVDAGAHLALKNLPENSPVRRDLEDIRSAAEKAARLTRQLLTFGHQKAIPQEAADLGSVLRELDPLIAKLVGTPIDVRVEVVDRPLRVGTDKTQIEQIVMNLVANARDAMPAGGTLTVRASPTTEDGAGAKSVLLSVEDSGQGIAPEVRRRMFEPFFTTKAPGRGTGLGLSTVYGIVKQLDGRIEVESTLGAGTTFKVWLPEARSATA